MKKKEYLQLMGRSDEKLQRAKLLLPEDEEDALDSYDEVISNTMRHSCMITDTPDITVSASKWAILQR